MSNDDHLQRAVLAELNWEPGVTAAHIGVAADADAGAVTLTGHVETFAEKHAAEAAALRVKGVQAVADELEVRLSPETRRTDEAIAAAAVERLAWDVSVPEDAVQVLVEDGWVTLSGEIDWHYQRAAAEQDVQRLHGVVGVNNLITIKSTVQPSDISDEIMHALHRSWFFDPKTIDVSAEGGTVRLTGTVHSTHERQVAAATAWSAPGVTEVENDIVIV
jgi:osmotically-inducible protein OsmY